MTIEVRIEALSRDPKRALGVKIGHNPEKLMQTGQPTVFTIQSGESLQVREVELHVSHPVVPRPSDTELVRMIEKVRFSSTTPKAVCDMLKDLEDYLKKPPVEPNKLVSNG